VPILLVAPISASRTVKPSILFVPPIISFAHFCFKLVFLPPTGLRHFIRPHLLNILPTKTLQFSTQHFILFGTMPNYEHLCIFGCKCYPNLSAATAHKLAPRSAMCVFLGYSAHHKGYRCLDLSSNRIIISRHIVFDESSFPFAEQHT